MADALVEAKNEVQAGVAEDRLNKFVQALGGTARADAVFGDPVERDGVTIVPVARVRFGGGGGSGRGPGRRKRGEQSAPDQEGYGHGGGAQATPLGYIELRDGQARYKRIADPVRPMAMLMLFPVVGVICFALMAVISLQTAKSARKLLPTMPHLPHLPLPSFRWND
jgi:uncharacterized spore protein YtfJ